jgi:signal transduction histidine kinase
LRVTVRDDGPGIPPEHLAQVTEPFYRVDAARSSDGSGAASVGLGLSIADTVARAHGGALRLVNRAGGGLDVIVELPRS